MKIERKRRKKEGVFIRKEEKLGAEGLQQQPNRPGCCCRRQSREHVMGKSKGKKRKERKRKKIKKKEKNKKKEKKIVKEFIIK